MTGEHARQSTTTTRVIRASAKDIYSAFVDPVALVDWLPPGGMTGRIHAFDARVGGGYEMSLYYPATEDHLPGKFSEHEDRVLVRFIALDPPRRLVEVVRFQSDDPAFPGEMKLTISLEEHPDGTAVTMAFENLPPGVRPEDNDAGARMSLEQLARRLERGAPGHGAPAP